jgi:hypothetical protein
LLERLITAALERGITRLRFECLAHNIEMQNLVKSVCRVAASRREGEIVVVETDLPRQVPVTAAPATPALISNFYELFRAIVIHSVDLHLSLSRAAMKRIYSINIARRR